MSSGLSGIMMPKFNSQLKTGSTSVADRNVETSVTHLMRTDRVENPTGNCVQEEAETGKCLSCASSLSSDSGFGSDSDDHVTDGLGNVSSDFCSEDRELKIDHFVGNDDKFVDSGEDKSIDCEVYNVIKCSDHGKVTQDHRTFIEEDEQMEKRYDCFIGKSGKENKINCDELHDKGKHLIKVIFNGDVGEVEKSDKDVDEENAMYSFQTITLSDCSSLEETDSCELGQDSAVETCLDCSPLCRRFTSIDSGDVCSTDLSIDSRDLRKTDIIMDSGDVSYTDLAIDPVIVRNNDISIDTGRVCNTDINLEMQNRTRDRIDSVNSAVFPKDSPQLRTVRRRRRRRQQVQDVNNNSASPRSLTSFLRKLPFTFNDCFHDKGFLLLVVCIIYTLILMVIISFICVVMETFKAAIGTENLKKIRRKILGYRHTRMSMAAA